MQRVKAVISRKFKNQILSALSINLSGFTFLTKMFRFLSFRSGPDSDAGSVEDLPIDGDEDAEKNEELGSKVNTVTT